MTVAILSVIAIGDAKADFTLGEPANLGLTVNRPGHEVSPSISTDELELYFGSNRSGGYGDDDIWVTTRPTVEDEWAVPTNLGSRVNSSSWDGGASLSADGLSLYFSSTRAGGYGNSDIWVTERATRNDDWGTPVNLGPIVNSSADETVSAISFDGLQLLFNDHHTASRPGGLGDSDLWTTMRPTVSDPWEPPLNLGPSVNSSASDSGPCVSADGLVLFFSSERPGGYGRRDLWTARRASADDDWDAPVNLGSTVNSSVWDGGAEISADGRTLYFHSGRTGPGGYGNGIYDLWQVPIEPVVDFNTDYQVDIKDLLMFIEHWSTNVPLYDIGPTPLGDGVVDAQDLQVLMSHWGNELYDPYFIALWKLDETEGDIAYDSAAENDAAVIGDATWQPEGGRIDGALQLDGIDDHIQTPRILNPQYSAFSVFAWVKGGAPGQVIISQADGVNWLLVGSDGTLMTELRASRGREAVELYSEAMITDDNWHKVGFTWDGDQRSLYVDDDVVASETQPSLKGSSGDLHIGAGAGLESGSFWSGMIDDVRIYDRVVVP